MKLKGNFVLMGILCFKFEISAFWQNERTCCMGNLKFLEPRETERDPCKLTITIHTVELVGANASDIQCQEKKKKKKVFFLLVIQERVNGPMVMMDGCRT